jgi:ParB family transcriptional regulator, chromosome partitioning protein
MTTVRKRGLGMGLSALLGSDTEPAPGDSGRERLRFVPIEQLRASPLQPRQHFADEELELLAQSLRDRGVLQPLVVRAARDAVGYEIVAGERRWRAAQKAGLHELPVVVRELDDREVLELALIENLQRQDLNALEEARAYRRLMSDFAYTQDSLGSVVGKSRPHIANTLRLLNLPDEVQALVTRGELSAGHARALLGARDPGQLAREVIRRGLTVRETEHLTAAALRRERQARPDRLSDPDLDDLERQLGRRIGLAVAIRPGRRGGTLVIRYSSPEQLDALVERLG